MNRHTSADPAGVTAGDLPPRVRLFPAGLTAVTFTRVRRGLDPREVHALLYQIAVDLAARDRDIAALLDENHRLKNALSVWQTKHAPTPTDHGYRHRPPQAEPSPPAAAGTALPHRQPGPAHGWESPTAAHPTQLEPGPEPFLRRPLTR